MKYSSTFGHLFSPFSPFAAVSLFGVAGLAETFPSFSVSGPFLLDFPGFQVPSGSIFPSQLWSSSRALPLHLHFCNCSDVFSFTSPFDVSKPFQPSPSHNRRYRFHLCFFQDFLISPVFQQAHAHCPSHHSHLCCCHTLFIFDWHWPCFASVKQSRSKHGCRIILDSQLTRDCRLGWVELGGWVAMRIIRHPWSNHCLIYQELQFCWDFLVADHSTQFSPFRPCRCHSVIHVFAGSSSSVYCWSKIFEGLDCWQVDHFCLHVSLHPNRISVPCCL